MWNFEHLDHVLTQITSQHAGIGGIMAAMVYQIDQDSKKKVSDKKKLDDIKTSKSVLSTAKLEDSKHHSKSSSSVQAPLDKEA